MNTSAPRLLTVIGMRVGNRVVTAAARAWEAAVRGTARAFAKANVYLRWRCRAALEELRPYECDTVQKRKVHREAWLAELERHELERRAVPMTARTAAREAREWTERIAAVEARYDVMRDELRELRKFSLLQIPFDRNRLPREAERFAPPRQVKLRTEFSPAALRGGPRPTLEAPRNASGRHCLLGRVQQETRKPHATICRFCVRVDRQARKPRNRRCSNPIYSERQFCGKPLGRRLAAPTNRRHGSQMAHNARSAAHSRRCKASHRTTSRPSPQ
jgi:hypothetical protein